MRVCVDLPRKNPGAPGKWYLFYHDALPSGGNGFRRSTAIREFRRNTDGSIPYINLKQ